MKRFASIMLALCIFAIAPVNAEHDQEFFDKVRMSGVVNDNESIILSSNVYFYPNKNGHGIFSGGGNKREKGHIIFTENGFSVISWSRRNKEYEVLHEEAYSDLAGTGVSGNSPMVRLVTQTQASENYNSYELMDSRNALTPNVSKTKEARNIVNAGIQGLDVKQVANVTNLSVAEVAMQKQKMQALEERIQRLENANPETQAKESDCDCKCEK